MSFWNIHIATKEQGDKDISIYDECHITLKVIIDSLIEKYTDISHFFEKADKDHSRYETENISVTIMNDNSGYVYFRVNSAVNTITISKRELYLLQNI